MDNGKKYILKTFAHYYLGELVNLTATHAIIKNASEVYETGPLKDFYGKGIVKACERLPDGWGVPMSGTCFGPWEHPLPEDDIL